MKFFDKFRKKVRAWLGREPVKPEVEAPAPDAIDPEQPAKTYTGRRARRNVILWSAEWLMKYNHTQFQMKDGARYQVMKDGSFRRIPPRDKTTPVKLRKKMRRIARHFKASQEAWAQ